MCGATEELFAHASSGWRAIKAETKIYYFCKDCQPENKQFASSDEWAFFYRQAIKKIYKQDFRRPIRKILFLRDMGGNPQIINSNLN